MGEVAGVTSCRPAMLQRGGGGGGSAPPVVHFISFHNPLQRFTVGERKELCERPSATQLIRDDEL